MNAPTGRLQFFGLEASDYLERLEIMFRRPSTPDIGELIRLTRALRGSAVMAGLQTLAHAASGLERIAKSLRDGTLGWDQLQNQPIGKLLEQFRTLVKRATSWTPADTDAANALATSFAAISGNGADDEPKAAVETGLTPTVRAFVGREGALVAGTLEHAAEALALGQPAAAADAVLHRLQPLRGLAALPDISPLPEFLDAVELAIKGIRHEAAPPDGPLALRSAAAAVAHLAKSIATTGTTAPDAPEVTHGAVSLLETFGREDDVVPVSSLFPAGEQRPIVEEGSPPHGRQSTDSNLELVSLADRLRHAAEQLSETESKTGRSLLLYALVVQLRVIGPDGPEPRPPLQRLLAAISRAMGSGRAGRAIDGFARSLRKTAERLMRIAEVRSSRYFGDEFDALIAEFDELGRRPGVAVEPAAHPVSRPAPPNVEPSRQDDQVDAVVPIETLLLDSPPAAVAEAPSPFEQSFSSYHRLIRQSLGSPTSAEDGVLAASRDEGPEPVAITSLLLRGRRALERANEVRLDLSASLKQRRPFVEIEPLVSELIDLVPLALED